MTIKEVFQLDGFDINGQDLFDLSSMVINNNSANITLKEKLELDEEVEFVYYWNDHLTRGTYAVENIEKSLNNKDWNTFSKYYFDELPHKCTLPSAITIFTQKESILLGYVHMNENTMKYLTCSEYECG